MNAFLFLGVRALHVLVAGLWIGATVYQSFVLMPAVDESGPSGGQVMVRMNQRGLNTYFKFVGFGTVVSGIYLLWRFTGGFSVSPFEDHGALAFCTGGVSGILAAVIGGAIVGRTGTEIMTTLGQVVATPDGDAKRALILRAAALRTRMKIATRTVIALQATALVLMAVGHYV